MCSDEISTTHFQWWSSRYFLLLSGPVFLTGEPFQDDRRVFHGIIARHVLIHLLREKMFGDLHEQVPFVCASLRLSSRLFLTISQMRYNATVADFQGPLSCEPSLFFFSSLTCLQPITHVTLALTKFTLIQTSWGKS